MSSPSEERWVAVADASTIAVLAELFPHDILSRKTGAQAMFLDAYYLKLTYSDAAIITVALDYNVGVCRTSKGSFQASPKLRPIVLKTLEGNETGGMKRGRS